MGLPTRWGPFTRMGAVVERGPHVIVRAEGVWVWDEAGRRFLDAHGGLWLANVGYGRTEIIEAMHRQAQELAWFSSFGGFANRPSLELADRLVDLLAPDGMAAVFFSNDGSEANETALKICRQYWKLRGRAAKVKLIGRQHAYHGVTLGALAVAGILANRQPFEPLLAGVRHVPAPIGYGCPYHPDTPVCSLACARELERTIQMEGPDTVAAFILEPVQAAGGVIIPPPEYLAAVERICRRYDVLLVVDEVVTGFGRLGAWTGSRHYGIRPDIMTFAKGITSGYMPLGATAVTREILETFLGAAGSDPEFRHGHTYSGHPVAAAAALANLAIIEREDLPGRAATLGMHLADKLRELAARHPDRIRDAANVGLLGRVALVDPKGTAPAGSLGARVSAALLDAGIIARAVGDVITLSPPLVISQEELDLVVDALDRAIAAL